MTWTFESPKVTAGDGNIDAACIYADYAGGGFCAGVKYEGAVSPQRSFWAQWSSSADFEAMSPSLGLSGVDDAANWETEEEDFTA